MKKARKHSSPGRLVKPFRSVRAAATTSQEQNEILAFPVKYLLQLPVPVYVTLRLAANGDQMVWTSATRERSVSLEESAVYYRNELRALLVAAETGRGWQTELAEWNAAKRSDPDRVVDADETLSGVRPMDESSWTLSKLMRWYGCELVSLELQRPPEDAHDGMNAAA